MYPGTATIFRVEMSTRKGITMPAQRQSQPATQTAREGTVQSLTPFQRQCKIMAGMAEIEATDTEYTGDDIMAILNAEDEAAMWAADDRAQLNAKVLSGCELEIYGFGIRFSGNEGIASVFRDPSSGKRMYVLLDSARINAAGESNLYRLPGVGEKFQWNTSARFIVAKIMWLNAHGAFDNGKSVRCRIEGTDLGDGRSVEKLKPLTVGNANATVEPPF